MSQLFPAKLSRYLAVNYAAAFGGLLLLLLGIIYLFDSVELLRRAAKFDDVSSLFALQMGFLKLPEVGQLVLPFAVLFSAIFVFWRLARRHELVIIRASGLSVWQFLAPVIGVAILIGIMQITVVNPLGAALLSRYETLENKYLRRQKSVISFSEQGLWLRQEVNNAPIVLHAKNIKMPGWILENVIVFYFSPERDFLRRIDAKKAVLEEGKWSFQDVVMNTPGHPPEKIGYMSLATDLTLFDIEKSYASPKTIPFWQLKSFIKTMEMTGFDATPLRIHYQALLAQPLLFAAMVLLAAAVSLRPPRTQGTMLLIVGGVMIGFMVFFLSSFLQALGGSGQLPPVLAAWSPALITFLFGIGAMMALEDG